METKEENSSISMSLMFLEDKRFQFEERKKPDIKSDFLREVENTGEKRAKRLRGGARIKQKSNDRTIS